MCRRYIKKIYRTMVTMTIENATRTKARIIAAVARLLRVKVEESEQYDPDFVAKIRRAHCEKGRVVDIETLWADV